jgi:LacI family transcriptional regulator
MKRSLRQLLNRKVDGILLVPLEINLPEHEEILWKLKLQRIPFVYVNDQISRVPSDYVGIDLAAGVNLIAEHLIKLGHKRIGCVSAEPYINITTTKVRTLVATLKKLGLDLNSDKVIISDKQHEEGGYEAAMELLGCPDRPTAIVATSDIIAVGVIQAAKSLGISVPQDVSVIGIDDIDIARMTEPPLTTVKQPVEEMAEKAAEILLKRIEGEISPDFQHHVFSPKLIVRESTYSP